MGANSYQVDGTHYRGEYQHWDLVLNCGLGYLEGRATAHLARWRKKGEALNDLQKAKHYTEKLRECSMLAWSRTQRALRRVVLEELHDFVEANRLSPEDSELMVRLATWETKDDLTAVIALIDHMIHLQTDSAPAPLEDSNKHADRAVPRFRHPIPGPE